MEETLGKRIVAHRKRLGMTQMQISRRERIIRTLLKRALAD